MVKLKEIAKVCGIGVDVVRNVLKESGAVRVSREIRDKIFQTARKLGYDFPKLKLGKQLDVRKSTAKEVLTKIESNKGWGRREIVDYLRTVTGMVDRVQKRAFPEEFGEEDWI